MASTYTDRNRFEKQGDGENENTWGQKVNTVIDLVDEAMDGFLEVDVSGGNVVLTTTSGASDQARNRVLRIVGEPGSDRTVTIPDVEKQYFIEVALSGSQNVTIKNVADSNGVSLSAGTGNFAIVCDGTSTRTLLEQQSDALLQSNNLSDLTNVSAARVNLSVTDSATLKSEIFDIIYPVGSIYVNYSVATNPGTLLGYGTWIAEAEGRVMVGEGSGTDVNGSTVSFTATDTGGEYTHTLTTDEIPAHTHTTPSGQNTSSPPGAGGASQGYHDSSITGSTGGGSAHNIQQPWVAVYIWRRTA